MITITLIYSEAFAILLLQQICSFMSSNETLQRTLFSELSSSKALNRLSDMVLRSIYLINVILLSDRLPEQFRHHN